jgi:hypothetical protein
MSISDYYFEEINSEENLQELANQEPPAFDEHKEERAGFGKFTHVKYTYIKENK